jgi:hypothetical protein
MKAEQFQLVGSAVWYEVRASRVMYKAVCCYRKLKSPDIFAVEVQLDVSLVLAC